MRRFLAPFLSLLFAGLAIAGVLRTESSDAAAPEPAVQVSRMVSGIIGYARWPQTPETYRFCVAGKPAYLSGNAGELAAALDVPLTLQTVGDAGALSGCDVLYLAGLGAAQRAALLAAAIGRPVLTLVENDPLCADPAMFCLSAKAGDVGLLVNVDAISRSAVRVNPKVLQLVRRRQEAQ